MEKWLSGGSFNLLAVGAVDMTGWLCGSEPISVFDLEESSSVNRFSLTNSIKKIVLYTCLTTPAHACTVG